MSCTCPKKAQGNETPEDKTLGRYSYMQWNHNLLSIVIKNYVSCYMVFVKESLNVINKVENVESETNKELDNSSFLKEFQDIFTNDIPRDLPSSCKEDDHTIDLLPASSPPNKPPYRVSQAQ